MNFVESKPSRSRHSFPSNLSAILVLTILLLPLLGCATSQSNSSSDKAEVTVEGLVKKAEATTFMYGTHLLYDDGGQLTYALTSKDVNLSQYRGKRVRLGGTLVDGYPVENGPPYLRVTQVHKVNDS